MERVKITCPNCEIALPRIKFLVMMFLTGEKSLWCPECGLKWIEEKWIEEERENYKVDE